MSRYIALGLACFLFSCDMGDSESEGEEQESKTTGETKTGTETPQCTKHTTCEYGELCLEKKCQVPEGAPSSTAYDFTRTDECPGSKTYTQNVTLSDSHGKVVLLYFATSGCAACQADVKVYQGLVSQLDSKGFLGMGMLITVLLPGSAGEIAAFTSGLIYPVVVDDFDVGIADHYGAAKDTLVLIDGAGYVVESWPAGLEVRGQGGETDKDMLLQKMMELAVELL
jgi:thiol-disulfide isomerase/thioredoxin